MWRGGELYASDIVPRGLLAEKMWPCLSFLWYSSSSCFIVLIKSDIQWRFPLLKVVKGLKHIEILLCMAAHAICGSELDYRGLYFHCGFCFRRGSHVKWIRHAVVKGKGNYCAESFGRWMFDWKSKLKLLDNCLCASWADLNFTVMLNAIMQIVRIWNLLKY